MIVRVIQVALALLLFVCEVAAFSQARSPLQYLEVLSDARIRAPKGRVHAYSQFDIELDLRSKQRIKLTLQPNHDILGEDATVSYLDADGRITHQEVIERTDHKVFRGMASERNLDGSWSNVGWARITVLRDGIRPLFEGAFAVNHDSHHIQLSSTYMRTKHERDPALKLEDDEFMVLFKDSDAERYASSDLKRSLDGAQCMSHELEFNTRPDHPVYQGILTRNDGEWGSMRTMSLFGKRQTDTQTTGNSAAGNLTISIGQSAGCPSTRRVALVGVAADCGYTANFNSTQTARATIISVMNAASSAWENSFNISLGLQNLTLMAAACPGDGQTATPWNRACNSNLNIQSRLNLFSAWRGTLVDTNSHWTMFTSCADGDTVGLAWLGQACVHNAVTANVTGGGSETVSGANVVALTSTEWQVVAHETGHTFGAVHDCTTQTCGDGTTLRTQQCCPHASNECADNDQLYIMNPFSTSGINTFSPCTVGNICSAIGRNSVNTSCLSTNKNIPTISGAQCGNGIVEEGEDCDCGGAANCADDPCCNPTTCKFVNGAVCDDANDDCCDSCQFSRNGTICRESTGICDPAETCTGSSGNCPANIVAPDGQTCANGLQCASGQCTSRNLQCETVMSGYFSAATANQTYACDETNCLLSCASPAFGPGACYGLQQNLLDGTPCAGDGACYNGVCRGATAGGQIKSWIDDHKTTVIGIAAGIGSLVVVVILSCCCSCIRRGKRSRKIAPPAAGRLQRPPMEQQQWPTSPQAGWRPPPQQQQHQYGWNGPVPPQAAFYGTSSSPPLMTGHQNFYAPPPGPPPPQHQALYGAGIIGSRDQQFSQAPYSPPPYPTTFSPPAGRPGESARYA